MESDAIINESIEPSHEYEFRVMAINTFGQSESSRSSKPVLAQDRFIKPRIAKDQLKVRYQSSPFRSNKVTMLDQFKERVVLAGQDLKVEVNFRGEPKPRISWWSPNGAKLENSDKCQIIDSDQRSVIELKSVSIKEAGLYKVKAKNSEGLDEAEFKLVVQAPPSRPQGPLEVVDVTPSSCTLKWRRPSSDGGTAIKGKAN